MKPRVTCGVWQALTQLRFELYVQRLHRAALRKANVYAGVRPLRLNLASGFHPKPGWINIDLIDGLSDLQLDLREPLPFADSSVTHIYTEHFFEHLTLPAFNGDSLANELETASARSNALNLLRECFRVLAPGGRLDIIVPDAEAVLNQYVAHRGEPLTAWWGPAWCDTAMHRVNYYFRQGHEHQYAYDSETLQRIIQSVGFVHVERRAFDPALDHRGKGLSLFVVARKPALP